MNPVRDTGLKQKLDYDDYARIPPDGKRSELLEGDLLVTPAPSAPIDVILTLHDVVQPDLVVVTDPAQISRRGIEGAPALVVEVLSPTTRDHDRTTKASRLDCYRLERGEYVLAARAEGDQSLTHPDWPGLTLALADLWR